MTWLGQAAVLGFDPAALVRAGPVELALMVKVVARAAEYRAERDRALARSVVSELAEALKRGRHS